MKLVKKYNLMAKERVNVDPVRVEGYTPRDDHLFFIHKQGATTRDRSSFLGAIDFQTSCVGWDALIYRPGHYPFYLNEAVRGDTPPTIDDAIRVWDEEANDEY